MKNDNLLLEELKRINFVMNYEVGELATNNKTKKENKLYESKIDDSIKSLISENNQRILLNEAASAAIMTDLKNKIKPLLGSLKMRNNGKYPTAVDVYGFSGNRWLTFFDNGAVKWHDGKNYTKGGKWDFNMVKGGKLSGGWLKNDKGVNVSLYDAINYPAKNYGTGAGPLLQKTLWDRFSDGDVGYWKALFTNLQKAGIGVKWEVPNNPEKSTFMYWGMWVIWKDLNKNGGWPISFSSPDNKLWVFRWFNKKYAGQPTDIQMESKYIGGKFALIEWGKSSAEGCGKKLNELKQSNPKNKSACKTADGKPLDAKQIPTVATQIFDDLKYAFDGGGTFEKEAVDSYKKITCKEILDAVNAKVAARNMKSGTFGTGDPIKTVADWAKDEMSDYDYTQYREIWAGLQKLGYTPPPVNQAYRVAGAVGEATGINSMEKAAEGIQQLFSRPIDGFEKIIDAVRSFLGGIAGGIVTTILDFTGIGKVATTIGWGIIMVGDIIVWAVKGVPKIPEMLLSIVSMLTTGTVGTAMGRLLKPFFGTGTSIGNLIAKLSGSKWLKTILDLVENGMAKIGEMASSAIKWITGKDWWKKYFANSVIGKQISSAYSKITKFVDDFAAKASKNAGSTATTNQSKEELQKLGTQKVKTAMTTDAGKELGWAGAEVAGEEIGGEKGKQIVQANKAAYNMGRGTADINTNKLPAVATANKEFVKTTDATAKIAGFDVNKEAEAAEKKRREEAEAQRQKDLANAKTRDKYNVQTQNKVNPNMDSTRVAK